MTDVVVSGYLFSTFRILMPKRKARKSLFSSYAAWRIAARVEHKTEDDRYERLRIVRDEVYDCTWIWVMIAQ